MPEATPGTATPVLPGVPPSGKKDKGGCCSVSREGTGVEVIEEHTKVLYSLQEHISKQQTASSQSKDANVQEISNVTKMVTAVREQQQREFEKLRSVLDDIISQQKAVMDRQKNLQDGFGQQRSALDRQESLVQQLLDQMSLDREFDQAGTTNVNARIVAAQNVSNGYSDSKMDQQVEPLTFNASPRSEAPGQNYDDGGGENGKKKRTSIQDMANGIVANITGKKPKKNRKSVEGRSAIGNSPAPWNQEHDEEIVSVDAPIKEKKDEEDDLFPCLTRMARSKYFKTFFGLLILTNTVFVAVQVQHTSKNPDSKAPPLYITLSDMGFCVLFVWEIIVRMLVERCAFFKSETRYWNMFDLLLVILAFQEQVSSFALIAKGRASEVIEGKDDKNEGGNFTFLRLVRMLRVLRILRVFKYCPQLIVLVQGILESMSAMVWLFALLGLTMFTASLVFMSATANFIKSEYGEVESQHLADMKNHFGTLSSSTFSLFKAVSGGLEWAKLGDGLMKISAIYGFLFILYLAFVIFGIVNVMTGVFVISAMKTAKQTDEDIKRKNFQDVREYLDNLTNELDPDMLTRDLFMAELDIEDGPMSDMLKPLDLGKADAAHLFDLMMDSQSKVSATKLTQGFLRLLGGAKNTDLVFVLLETRRLANEMFGFFCFCEANFRTLATAVGVPNGQRRYLQK